MRWTPEELAEMARADAEIEADYAPTMEKMALARELDREAGATDQEIAEAVGATKTAVRRWRQHRQMSCNQGPRGARRTWDTARARELWALGYMDREIGEAVGVGKKAIQHWRGVEGLPANGRAGRQRRGGRKDDRAN